MTNHATNNGAEKSFAGLAGRAVSHRIVLHVVPTLFYWRRYGHVANDRVSADNTSVSYTALLCPLLYAYSAFAGPATRTSDAMARPDTVAIQDLLFMIVLHLDSRTRTYFEPGTENRAWPLNRA